MGCSGSSARENQTGNRNVSIQRNQEKVQETQHIQENKFVVEEEQPITKVDLIIERYSGILYDNNSYLNEGGLKVLKNDNDLNEFKDVIASKLIQSVTKISTEYYDNVDDYFLNNDYNCDFNYNNIVVICGAKAQEIYRGEDEYRIVYSQESCYNNYYYAYVVKEKYIGFSIENYRPSCINEQRTLNEDPRYIVEEGKVYNQEVLDFVNDLVARGVIDENQGLESYKSVDEVKRFLDNYDINY